MRQIIEKPFWDIFYNAELEIIEIHWKNAEKQYLQEEIFKTYLLELVECIKQWRPIGFLVDTRKFHIIMSPEFQTWHDTEIIPLYIKYSIRNIIFILNEVDFLVPAISIQQTFDEQEATAIPTHYMDSLEEAREFFQKFA